MGEVGAGGDGAGAHGIVEVVRVSVGDVVWVRCEHCQQPIWELVLGVWVLICVLSQFLEASAWDVVVAVPREGFQAPR